MPNLVALLLGTGVVLVAQRAPREGLSRWAPLFAALGIATTLFGDGVDGVARWVNVGGLQVHASAALAPWLLLGLAAESSTTRRLTLLAALVVQLVHVLQPDAGQATALAAGALAILAARTSIPRLEQLGASAALTGAAALAWLRPDPLEPVDHVERILFLAYDRSPVWVVAIVGAMLPLFGALAGPGARARAPATLAALGYLAACFGVSAWGQFPVPVFGAGFATTLGWFALVAVPRGPIGAK